MLASSAFDDLDAEAASMSADLSSWDFLQDLDFGVDLAADGTAQAQAVETQLTSTERVREQNRKAQQRARQKKKERSANIEAQLAETTSQLQHLRLRQRQLEARNNLLELAAANKESELPALAPQRGLQAEAKEVVFHILGKAGLVRTQHGTAFVLTVHGCDEEIKMDDIGRMACTDFAELYTVFVRRKAKCLLDLESSTSSSNIPALTQLHQWSVEATATFVCFVMGKPLGTLQSLNMENATLSQEPSPDDALDALLATISYSGSQQQDMLHLRRLFYGKLGQLSRARAAMMAQMPAADRHDAVLPFNLDIKSSANKFTETKEWADQLCANRAEESRAYLYCGVCLLRGITSSVQQAKAMVHQYPRVPNTKALLEVLAKLHKEPPAEILVQNPDLDDLQLAANWETVVVYVQSLDANGVHGYAPFCQVATMAGVSNV
ncbi:TPA: hypothetical protein ACH3X1_015897 [Trebouxia sp. C0004]